ncbi:DUF2380 domain-containing protein [Rhizobium sp. SEMIA 4085]|nr:DUF2380 domain-containing protein [Rhizobium sp. SEMIA 4085]
MASILSWEEDEVEASFNVARRSCIPGWWVVTALACASALASVAVADTIEPITVAVANFDFKDTSGEAGHQLGDHDARLTAFASTLRDSLSKRSKIIITSLACQNGRCTAREPGSRSFRERRKLLARITCS